MRSPSALRAAERDTVGALEELDTTCTTESELGVARVSDSTEWKGRPARFGRAKRPIVLSIARIWGPPKTPINVPQLRINNSGNPNGRYENSILFRPART